MTTIEKVMLVVIVLMITLTVLSAKTCATIISDRGLKSIVDEVWEGNNDNP